MAVAKATALNNRKLLDGQEKKIGKRGAWWEESNPPGEWLGQKWLRAEFLAFH